MSSPAEVLAAAEAAVRDGLTRIAAHAPGAILPEDVLGERQRLAGPGFVPRSAFRILQAADGWLALSLPRESDCELLPALIQGLVGEPWEAVASWLVTRPLEQAESRAVLLGLPAARIPRPGQAPRRPPVIAAAGGPRTPVERPLVVDLSSLWAGPLAARLLGLVGARVLKVESVARPDGGSLGPPEFFRVMHAGHESKVIDFADRAALRGVLESADIVIEASRPRALRQLGLRAEEFAARGSVWVSITAYGRDDANAMRVGFGDDVAAGAGLVAYLGGVPRAIGDALGDPITGVAAAAAALDQLATGGGAVLDVSMHDVCCEVAARIGTAGGRGLSRRRRSGVSEGRRAPRS